jgi:hypothetical protein
VRVPARSAVELSARSALKRVHRFVSESSDRIAFVLISSEVQLGTGAVQSVCRPSNSLRVCKT